MAADHRRKRLNDVGISGCSVQDQHKTKKKKLELQKNNFNAKSLIYLEWDGKRRKVVAKKEQVGISLRDLRPFINPSSVHQGDLADAFVIPREVFELENLAEVLRHEVWQTHLSEKERKFLKQFLPEGVDAEEVVQNLLSGDNFHFGNPFLKWSASLCSGDLHPDSVLNQERCLKSHKKAYYSGIQNYHKGMIQCLLKLKDAWEDTRDPEKEALQKMWRIRTDEERRMSSHSNMPGFDEPGENVVASSESCSLVADEKACSSDNQNSPVMKIVELHKSIRQKASMKEKSRNPLAVFHDARPPSEDQLQKHNIHLGSGAKYMSYLKISKKQHELVKSMKQAGKSVLYSNLNSVFGNTDTLHVQPYEEFVKEEEKKMQEQWLKLANKDLPSAYANWRQRKFQIQEMVKSLDEEMKEVFKSVKDPEEESDDEIMLQDQNDQESSRYKSVMKGEENEYQKTFLLDKNDQVGRNREADVKDVKYSGSDSLQSLSTQHISSPSGGYDFNPVETNSEINQSPLNHTPQRISILGGGHNCNATDIYSENNQSPDQISSLSGGYDLNPMDINSENNHVDAKSDNASPHLSAGSEHRNAVVDDLDSRGVPISSGGDVWSAVRVPNSYYDATGNLEYPCSSGLPHAHQVNEEQGCQMVDLGADLHGTVEYSLHRQSDGSLSSYQSHSFSNHDRSGLLQSLFKGQELLSSNHEQKQTGLDIPTQNNMVMENSQSLQHLQGQQLRHSLPLEEEGQKRLNEEDYMHQNLTEDLYSERGGYITPRQGHVPPINMQDWNINPVRIAGQPQSHLNDDGLLTHNWYSEEHQARDGWAGLGAADVPSQNIGSDAEQGIFNALSQFKQMRSSSSFEPMRSTGNFMLPRNYGMGVGGGIPRISDTLTAGAQSLDYLSMRDAANSLIPDGMGWMNLPRNSALHDPMGKPYLRSWDQ